MKRKQKRTLAGYRDKLSVRAGDNVNFKVSSFDGSGYSADLVLVKSGNSESKNTGLELEKIRTPFEGRYEGKKQITQCGSCAHIKLQAPYTGTTISFSCGVMPTTVGRGEATIASFINNAEKKIVELSISSDGYLKVRICVGTDRDEHSLDMLLPLLNWSVVGFSWNADNGEVCLFQKPIANGAGDTSENFTDSNTFETKGINEININELWLAAGPNKKDGGLKTQQHFNGRMDSPRLFSAQKSVKELVNSVLESVTREDLFAGWDFSKDMGGRNLYNLVTARFDGYLINLPVRAVKGIRWSSFHQNWNAAPEEYSAIHFHEYDIYDCEWETSFSYRIPDDLPSGAYAARLRKREEVEYITFFVLPKKSSAKAKIAFLASTASYLAYANDRVGLVMDALMDREVKPRPEEEMLQQHPEFGYSLYEHHVDGSGIHFSSYLRPIANLRPDSRVWSFTIDTDILCWLYRNGYDFDVITDDALHTEGSELLEGYRVLITGAHPEYCSSLMLKAIKEFTTNGGRLMYMGGNGFYWKIGYSADWPAAIEVRRAGGGTQPWQPKPAEYYQQFDGEYGGLWRDQDYAPQELVGVGFCAQGSPAGIRFRRQPGSLDPRAIFAFDGVTRDIVCDFKKMRANPSAEEVDRVDYDLGTPLHTLILASSENMPPDMMRTKEELRIALPQISDPDIRADVIFFETSGGGAVFSTGSIGWCTTLAHNQYENSAARITGNVLNRFLLPEPFETPAVTVGSKLLGTKLKEGPPGMNADKLPIYSVLKDIFRRCLMTAILGIVVNRKGFPIPPVPELRDSQLTK